MKPKTTTICCIQLAIVIALASTMVTGTLATQWFPADGTNCDYAISLNTSYNNNSFSLINTFDVYRYTSYLYVIPSIFHHTPSISWTSIQNNTQVVWRHVYTPFSPTQLNRTAGIVVGGTFYTASEIDIWNTPGSWFQRYTTSLIIQKANYYTGLLTKIFLDYFNCTARIGEQINPQFFILTNDGTQRILSYNYTSAGEYYTITGFADNTGHMTKWVVADYYPTFYASYKAHETAIAFTAITTPTSPLSLSATTGNNYVLLAWTAPASNGGSSITNYKIYRGTSSGSEVFLATIGNTLTYNNTNVTSGQTYYYTISAVNMEGEGPKSNEISIAPTSPGSSIPGYPIWIIFGVIALTMIPLLVIGRKKFQP